MTTTHRGDPSQDTPGTQQSAGSGSVTQPPGHPSVVRRALLDAIPLVTGYLPFGFVLGATVTESSVGNLPGFASSPLIFAGAAQLAVVELLDSGAGLAVVVATAWVINLRHVMYSGAIAPWFRDAPLRWRLFAPYVMADPVYSFAVVRFPEIGEPRLQRRYWAVFGGFLWLCWTTMTGVGIVLGARLPDAMQLELAVPMVFLALLVPTVTDRPTLAAAATGGLVTVAAAGLPLHLGLITGILAGVLVGLALDGAATDGKGTS
jgi:predicted branched-subunit amino acid permease